MQEDKGWISLYRKFLDWEWYDDANVMRLFIHLLLCANHKDNKWRGKVIRRGEVITSQSKLAHSLKLSIMQIRNSLNKLKSTGEITVSTTADYSVISIKNFNLYQEDNRLNNRLTTQKQQASNRLTTTNNNDNKRDINKLISLSIEEREILKNYLLELNKNRKNKIDDIDAYIRKLIDNGDCLTKLEKAKKRLERKKAKESIPPPEKNEDKALVDAAMKKARAQVIKGLQKANKGEKNG